MNVRITKIFGREITIQDEELKMPKYFKIKGVVKESSWFELFEFCSYKRLSYLFLLILFLKRFYKNKYKIILSLFALAMVLAIIGGGIWIDSTNRICKDGYKGNSCENCLYFKLMI